MAVFAYEAVSAGGRRVKGLLRADTPRQARDDLRDRGLVVSGEFGGHHTYLAGQRGTGMTGQRKSTDGLACDGTLVNVFTFTGGECQVSLRLAGHAVRLKAEIRRHQGRRYGMFFPEVLRSGELTPPVALKAIVDLLERLWLRQPHQ